MTSTDAPGPRGDPALMGPDPRTQKRANTTAGIIQANVEKIENKGVAQTSVGGQEGAGTSFPAQYFPVDTAGDTRIQAKQALQKADLGLQFITDQDVSWYQQKQTAASRFIFDEWFSRLFDTKDINLLRLAQNFYPEYFNLREEEIDRQAALQKKLALLKLRGPRDMTDLHFLYALQKGQAGIRDVPLHMLDQADEWGGQTQKGYQRGLFSPIRRMEMFNPNPPSTMGIGMFDHGQRTIPQRGSPIGSGAPWSGIGGADQPWRSLNSDVFRYNLPAGQTGIGSGFIANGTQQ